MPKHNKRMWDGKEDRFVELWQDRPCLFDVSSRFYHSRTKKNEAWKSIAAKLQLPIGEVMTHATSLRTQYGKLLHPRLSGSGTKEATLRQKWILKNMEFLKPHVIPRHSFSTLELNHDSQPVTPDINAEQDVENDEPDVPSPAPSSSPPSTLGPLSPVPSPQPQLQQGCASPYKRAYKSVEKCSAKEREVQIEEEKLRILRQIGSNSFNDAEEIFGKHVACELRLIKDPTEQWQLRWAITKLLHEAQERCMARSQQTPASSSPSVTSQPTPTPNPTSFVLSLSSPTGPTPHPPQPSAEGGTARHTPTPLTGQSEREGSKPTTCTTQQISLTGPETCRLLLLLSSLSDSSRVASLSATSPKLETQTEKLTLPGMFNSN